MNTSDNLERVKKRRLYTASRNGRILGERQTRRGARGRFPEGPGNALDVGSGPRHTCLMSKEIKTTCLYN